jgi:aspartate kinase
MWRQNSPKACRWPWSRGFRASAPRGGSPRSAAAGRTRPPSRFAAAFGAERCDIYTDVDGVYTADPRISDSARKLDKIAFEEMLELASLGAKVLQTRSVELAMRHGVRLQVRSSFSDADGTLVCPEEEVMETNVVAGVAHSRDEAEVTLREVADRPGIAAAIFGPLADAGINVDMIVQTISIDGRTTITFSCPTDQVVRAEAVLTAARDAGALDYRAMDAATNVCKVSVVGIGMRSHAGVAARMFRLLSDEGINIRVITTSEIKISVLIDRKYMELAVQALHDGFALGQGGATA